MLSRDPSGYDAALRWNAVAGCRRLSHLLARHLEQRLDSADHRQRHAVHVAERLDRRLRVRRVGDRRRWTGEPGQRLRLAGAAERADQARAIGVNTTVRRLRDALAGPLPGLAAQLLMAPEPRIGWDPLKFPEGARDGAALVSRLSARGHHPCRADGAWRAAAQSRGAGVPAWRPRRSGRDLRAGGAARGPGGNRRRSRDRWKCSAGSRRCISP